MQQRFKSTNNFAVKFAFLLATGSLLIALPAQAQNHAGHTMPTPKPAASSTKVSATPLPVTVQNATIVAVPGTIKETSAFMTLKNTSAKSVQLSGVTATIAGSAMLMKTIKSANMMGMVPAPVLIIPAKGTLTLKNDGDHVMLSALKRPLKVGEVLPIVLSSSDGRSLTVKATVKKP